MSAETKIEWTDRLRARFWSYVDRRGPKECWPWKGGLFTNGYGQFRLGKRKVKAHRCAFELERGSNGESQRSIADAFRLSQSQVGNIVRGDNWRSA